jgi:hypothetical protein
MAAIPASEAPVIEIALVEPAAASPAFHASLVQLAMLHDEARETAMLANLLGRAPQVALVLAGLALVTAALTFTQVSIVLLAAWLALVAAGIAAIARAFSYTIKAPFERVPLRSFATDLSAILFFAGFAWGAGAFLAVPATASAPIVLLFSAGTCAVVAALLRSPEHALFFLAPVAGLAALASLMRGQVAGLEVLVACGVVAAAVHVADRFFAAPKAPEIARIPAR